MSTGYKGIYFLNKEFDAVQAAREAFRAWLLHDKNGFEADLSRTTKTSRNQDETVCVVINAGATESTGLAAFQYSEVNAGRRWTVTLKVLGEAGEANETCVVLEVEVDTKPNENAFDLTAPPNLAKRLIAQGNLSDGVAQIHSGAKLLSQPEDVESLVEVILNPARRVAINVAPSQSSKTQDSWHAVVHDLASWTTGNALTFVLAPGLTVLFKDLLGDLYTVGPGYIRTYLPRVDLTSPEDAARHRYLSMTDLQREIVVRNGKYSVTQHLKKAFSRSARLSAAELNLDSLLPASIELERSLARTRLRSWMDAQQQPSESRDIPSVSGKVSGKDMQHPFGKVAKKLKAMLAEFVSRDEITEEAIDSLAQFIRHERDAGETILDDAAQKESQLKLLRDELKELRDEERLNSSYAKQLAYENQSLRKQKKQNNPESDLDFEKWEKASSSLMRFKYLVPKITAGSEDELRWLTRYVEFCGHGKQAFALDSHNLVDTYCDQVWEALHVLHDYAALKNSAKPYQGDLLRYLRERDHSGFAINSSRLSSESESLKNNKKLAKQRLLPVPKHIDSAGRLYMWDHFKFGNTPPAPRLYFYDATGEDGKIYIGYIGEHLENSLTN